MCLSKKTRIIDNSSGWIPCVSLIKINCLIREYQYITQRDRKRNETAERVGSMGLKTDRPHFNKVDHPLCDCDMVFQGNDELRNPDSEGRTP